MPTRLATTNHHQNVVNMQDLGRWVFAKASCSTDKAWLLEVAIPWTNYIFFSSTRIIIIPNSGSGLRWFACFPLFSLPIVPNSCVDLWWFAVICGRLWSFAMVCGGLSYSHTAGRVDRWRIHISTTEKYSARFFKYLIWWVMLRV